MSNPVTAICAAYIAYKAHNVEPLATIGKMWVAYKTFQFLNNLCFDWSIDHRAHFGTDRVVDRAIKLLEKSAHSCTTNPDGSIHYIYTFGGSTPIVLHRTDYTKTYWGKVDAILSKMVCAAPFIAIGTLAIIDTFMCPQTTGSGPRSALFDPNNDTIYL